MATTRCRFGGLSTILGNELTALVLASRQPTRDHAHRLHRIHALVSFDSATSRFGLLDVVPKPHLALGPVLGR